MKRLFLITSVALLVAFSACKKEEKVNTFVKVKVTNEIGQAQSNLTVCMFGERKGPNSAFFTPFHADKKVVTDSDGVATFDLQETFDLDVVDTQTTLYFAVQQGEYMYHQGVTIRGGETKSVSIHIPL